MFEVVLAILAIISDTHLPLLERFPFKLGELFRVMQVITTFRQESSGAHFGALQSLDLLFVAAFLFRFRFFQSISRKLKALSSVMQSIIKVTSS